MRKYKYTLVSLYWMCVEFLFLVESMDYRMIPVTSRSSALTKLIFGGHLLASDLDFYDDEPLNLDDDAS
jgi:hypothetical protein